MVHVVLTVLQMDHVVPMVHVHAIRNNLNKHNQKINYRIYLSKFQIKIIQAYTKLKPLLWLRVNTKFWVKIMLKLLNNK